ncbi:MAG: hypothetical protein ACRC10_09650 [Thermoguttaceae bacterium]
MAERALAEAERSFETHCLTQSLKNGDYERRMANEYAREMRERQLEKGPWYEQ